MKNRQPHALVFAVGIAAVLLLSLLIFYWLMQPTLGDLKHMAQFLSVTAVISVAMGYGAYRSNWLERAPSLRWVLLGTYVLASVLTFINVWLTARLMFASKHDLLLATVLLVFAGGIAVALGSFFTSTLITRINRLKSATQKIEKGDLSTRAEIPGNDEIASLAASFNQMANRLEIVDQKQKELDTLRRDLVAWAGHDLRTPLSSIRLLVAALSDGVVTDAEQAKEYLDQAKRHIDNLTVLVDELFQISQLDSGGMPLNREPSSLSDLISDTLISFSGLAASKGLQLTGSAENGLDPVTMDVVWMSRALNNLVTNAINHTPKGGVVNLEAKREGSSIRITVSDSGEGIQESDLPHIFDRFYRGDKSRSRASGGAGLGLAIVKGIVDAHKGSISVQSIPGKGTAFSIVLPKS